MTEEAGMNFEDVIPETDSVVKSGLFTDSELRDILIKRKLYENKLQKISKSKEDIIKYISFEIELLMKVMIKAKETGLLQKTSSVEYTMAHRISKLYYFALKRFPNDCKIWVSFIKFCKQMKLYTCVSRLFDQMLELHADKPVLFKLAANWEFHECHSIERARKFILKGLRTHKDSKLLLLEGFKIELAHNKQKLETQRGNEEISSSGIPKVQRNLLDFIFTSAINKIDDVSFFVALLNIAQEFSFTSSLQDMILERLKSKYPNEEVTWDTLARRELISGTSQEKIEKCISVYEEGLRNVPTKRMWSFYLSYVLELNEDLNNLPIFKKNCLKKALEAGHKENMLSEKHYVLWIKKVENVDTCKVLKSGTERLVSSTKLWSWRLRYHLSKSDEDGAMAVFKEIISNPNIPDQASLWMLILKCYQIIDTDKAETLWNEGVNNPMVGGMLKARYIEWLAMNRGIVAARNAYSTLATTPPLSLELHEAMAKLEDAQPKVSVKHMREVYDNAVNQYGRSNTDVWFWYLKFEGKFGEPEQVIKVYNQAIKTLNSNLVHIFISDYHYDTSELLNNARSRRGCMRPAEEDTWDVLARRELELDGPVEERIIKCISVYENGLKNVPTARMWSLYLDFVVEINEDPSTSSNFNKSCLKGAFEAAHKAGMLSEEQYYFWSTKVDSVDTCIVLQYGTERFGSSNKMWTMRLRNHLSKRDHAGAMVVLNDIVTHPNISDKASLWMLAIEHYQLHDSTKAEGLWNAALKDNNVGAVLKGRYIEWLAMTKGIMATRRAYGSLSITPPLSLDIHVAMYKLEDAQTRVNVKHARKVCETAINQFGKSNTDVWLWAIKFEAKCGDPQRILKIYDQAITTLNSPLVDVFISEYHLNVSETINNDRYQPQAILEKANVKLYSDQAIITEHTIPHNRPGILLIDKKMKKTIIVKIGVTADDNVAKTLCEKVRKYQELCEELSQLYQLVEVKVLSIIVSSNGLIPEETIKFIKVLEIGGDLQEVQCWELPLSRTNNEDPVEEGTWDTLARRELELTGALEENIGPLPNDSPSNSSAQIESMYH